MQQIEVNKVEIAFQSTPSVGRATIKAQAREPEQGFQSTPSVGRATITSLTAELRILISIHALRGEGDEPA